jgi:hypothetical protein
MVYNLSYFFPAELCKSLIRQPSSVLTAMTVSIQFTILGGEFSVVKVAVL